jgi:hypothetical protein
MVGSNALSETADQPSIIIVNFTQWLFSIANDHGMKALWAKAKKEATIVGSSALKAAGILKDPEDSVFLQQDAILASLRTSAATLRDLLQSFASDVQSISDSSNLLRENLKDPQMPATQITEITSAFIVDQLTEKCIKPVKTFLERVDMVETLKTKRHRNRELMQRGSEAEVPRRTQKYQQFHASFIAGVDSLASKHPVLVAQVFAYQQYFEKEYVIALKANLLQADFQAASATPEFPTYPDE